MTPTPETLRELLNKLLPIDEFDYERNEVWNRGHEAADAWETEQLEHASRIRGLDAAIEALRRRAEKHEVEFRWLLTHDSGDIGGVGRKRWLERKDALLAALAGEEKP